VVTVVQTVENAVLSALPVTAVATLASAVNAPIEKVTVAGALIVANALNAKPAKFPARTEIQRAVAAELAAVAALSNGRLRVAGPGKYSVFSLQFSELNTWTLDIEHSRCLTAMESRTMAI